MPAVDWTTVRKLVEAARQIPHAGRLEFLRKECGPQIALLDEVLSLLGHEGRAESFLEPPPAGEVAPLLRQHHAAGYIGKTIGEFEITGLLGYGGMGVVLQAKQAVPPREVALKVVRGGSFVDKRQLRLFEREIRSLARLSHPGVAALYEAGCTDDGQHYFAMELVEGEPVTQFIRQRDLPVDQRLALFGQICQAIHYAHQRGVIHRDLKPSNVLITAEARVKILDFGLAKITDSDLSCTSIAGAGGKVEGTVAYMSPEQARGHTEEIDIRSDVFSLGVMLYELLTLRLPYESGVPLPELIRQVSEEPPIRPSTVVRALRGDLETIVLKALEKDPSRRYDNAAALCEDVRRFLDKQPIAARPASTSYQLRRLAARHRGLLASVASIALLLVGSVVALSVLYARAHSAETQARSEAARADQRAKTAERLAGFLAEVFGENYPQTKSLRTLTAEDLLNIGVEKIHAELKDEPESQGYLLEVMSLVFKFHGDFDRAAELDKAALTYRAKIFAPDAPHMAASMANLAHDLLEMDRFVEAEQYAREALDIFVANYGPDNYFSATALSTVGRAITENHPDAAEPKLREALRAMRTLEGETGFSVGRTKLYLAEALNRMRQFRESELLSREVIESPSADADFRLIRPQAHRLLAISLLHQQQYEEARAASATALDLATELFGTEPRSKLVEIVCAQAAIEQAAGNPAVARELYEKALSMARDARWVAPLDLANALAGLAGTMLKLTGVPSAESLEEPVANQRASMNYVEIESQIAEALELRLTCLGTDHPLVADAARGLGLAILAQARFEKAEDLRVESFSINLDSSEGDQHALQMIGDIVKLYNASGQPDKAAAWREKLTSVSYSPRNRHK